MKPTPKSHIKPTRAEILRAVTTSTAIETGQDPKRIAQEMEAKRKKFAHLKLAD